MRKWYRKRGFIFDTKKQRTPRSNSSTSSVLHRNHPRSVPTVAEAKWLLLKMGCESMCQTLQILLGSNSPTISAEWTMSVLHCSPWDSISQRQLQCWCFPPLQSVRLQLLSVTMVVLDCRALGSNCPLWQSVEAGIKVPEANARLSCKKTCFLNTIYHQLTWNTITGALQSGYRYLTSNDFGVLLVSYFVQNKE